MNIKEAIPASLARQLGAITYDLVLLIAVILVAGAIITIPAGMLFDVHINAQHPLFRLYLFMTIFWFYVYFWLKGGQTLGMRAWRIKVLTVEGNSLTLKHATLRFFSAGLSMGCFGLGFLASVWTKDQQTWHDDLSATRLIVTEKSHKWD